MSSRRKAGKKSRKERAKERRDGELFVMVAPVIGGKLVKHWKLHQAGEEIQALWRVAGWPEKLEIWWDPFSRAWNACLKENRWRTGFHFPSIPYNASMRRWQVELGKILDAAPKYSNVEW